MGTLKREERAVRLGCKRVWNTAERAVLSMLFGGVGYGLIEVMWRGYTHPSMVITGGACFMGICFINQKMRTFPLALRSVICTAFVVVSEFCVGMIVNRILRLGVWDYSAERFNLLGQICLEYSFFWFLLCTALSFVITLAFQRDKT